MGEGLHTMYKSISRFVVFALAVAGLTVAALQGCKGAQTGTPQNLGALAATSSNISYQVGSGATWNLTSSQYPISLPPNSSVTIALQSNAGVYKTTFTLDCPGYLASPQSFVILSNDGGNASSFTFTTPNLVPARCTIMTQTFDGVSSFSNSINQFSIGAFGVIEVPITGVVSTDAASLTATSTSVLPPAAVVTGSYFAPTTLWDAACTIQVGQPVDGGNNALFGFYDAGTTLQAVGTVAALRERAYNEGGPMPVQVNLAAACEAGAGVIGVEYVTPGN